MSSLHGLARTGSDTTGSAPRAYPRRHGLNFLGQYLGVAIPCVLVLIYLSFPIYIQIYYEDLLPKYFYFGFLMSLGFMLFLKPKSFITYLVSPFAVWALALVTLNFIHYFSAASGFDPNRAALISTRILYILMAVFLGFVFSVTRTANYERAFVFLAVLIPSLVIFDFFVPGIIYPIGTKGTVPGRGSATFINPTIAGEAVLLCFLMACTVVRDRYRTPLLMLAGAGVLFTFSRSSIVAWILLWGFFLIRRAVRKSSAFIVMIALGGTLLLGGIQSYMSSNANFDAALIDIQERLEFFSNPNLRDDSARERAQVLEAGVQLFLHNPVTGEGAGATEGGMVSIWPYTVGPHNQLVLLGAEYGVAGVLLWISLVYIVLRGKYFKERTLQLALVFLFVFMSMFTHNMFEFPYWLVTYALVSGRRKE